MKKFKPSSTVYHDMDFYEDTHWWYRSLRDLLLQKILEINPKTILDAGCGTGKNIEFLTQKGFNVSGFDISDVAIKYCISKNLTKIKNGDITKFPDYKNKFDLIYSMDVLGNLDKSDLNLFLLEANSNLTNEGFLIINTSALPWLYSLHDKAWDIKTRYYLEDVTSEMEKNNFKIIFSSYRVSLLFGFVLISRILDKISSYFNNFNEVRGDLHKTNFLFDKLFYNIMRLENLLLKKIKFPIGSSIFIVAKKLNKS